MSLSHKIKLFAGTSHPALAKAIAKALRIPLSEMIITRFACGEVYARPRDSVRDCDVYVVQTGTQSVNEDLMELFVMLDSFKRSFAHKIHVVMPHYPYGRQDRVAEPREPISAKLVADLISKAGADHVITLALHSAQAQGFFDFPVDNLNVRRLFVDYFKRKKLKDVTVVAPDAGGARDAKKLAGALGAGLALLNKERSAHNKSEVLHLVGDVKGRTCIIYDDMVDTGGSVCNGKEALMRYGANKDVYLAATHPVLSRDAAARLRIAQFKEVIFTDTIPVSGEKRLSNMKILSVAPLLAKIIRNIHAGRAVTPIMR